MLPFVTGGRRAEGATLRRHAFVSLISTRQFLPTWDLPATLHVSSVHECPRLLNSVA